MWKRENAKELESVGTTSFRLKSPAERVRVDHRSKPIRYMASSQYPRREDFGRVLGRGVTDPVLLSALLLVDLKISSRL